jgi:integrase
MMMKKGGLSMNQWALDGRKFLTDEEIRRLKRVCLTEREKVIINLGLLAGLRVKEITDLKCGDITLNDEWRPACRAGTPYRPAEHSGAGSSLTVRNGKGGKVRVVRFNGELKHQIKEYFKWKETNKKGVEIHDPFIKSTKTGGHLSKRTLQRVFGKLLRAAGINGHSFHHLRHTYASHLYRASGYNLRLVQKQLGHANIQTTQVYADVFDEDLAKAVEKLYKPRTYR